MLLLLLVGRSGGGGDAVVSMTMMMMMLTTMESAFRRRERSQSVLLRERVLLGGRRRGRRREVLRKRASARLLRLVTEHGFYCLDCDASARVFTCDAIFILSTKKAHAWQRRTRNGAREERRESARAKQKEYVALHNLKKNEYFSKCAMRTFEFK